MLLNVGWTADWIAVVMRIRLRLASIVDPVENFLYISVDWMQEIGVKRLNNWVSMIYFHQQ